MESVSGRGLRPETRAFGERLGARFVEMTTLTSYWELFEELWTAEADFVLLEEDVLPTEELIRGMWECPEPWCSGTFGRWSVDRDSGSLWSDAQLGLVKFGSIRRVVPDVLTQAAQLFPARHWSDLAYGLQILGWPWTGFTPHLHLPHAVHLREGERYEDPWDKWEDWEAYRDSHVSAGGLSGLQATTMRRALDVAVAQLQAALAQ